MRVSAFFAWYDLWVGAYWDRQARALYVCPLPMVVVKFAKVFRCGECETWGGHYNQMLPGEGHCGDPNVCASSKADTLCFNERSYEPHERLPDDWVDEFKDHPNA